MNPNIGSSTTATMMGYTVTSKSFTTGTGSTLVSSTWSYITGSGSTYTTSKPYMTDRFLPTSRSTASGNPSYITKMSTSTRATFSRTDQDAKSTPITWGPWSADDPAYTWPVWTSQVDCVPVTKTFCGASGEKQYGCSVGVVAVPTKTIYVDWVTDVCETGITTKIVTVTATCNKGCDIKPTGVPQGFATSKVYCSACAVPSDVIVTIKNPDAPTGKVPGPGNNGNNGNNDKPGWSDGPAANPAKPTGVAGDDWLTWTTTTSVKPVDPAGGTWSAWNAPASGKPLNPASNTRSSWTSAASGKPANPTVDTWSVWNTPSATPSIPNKPVGPDSSISWSAWATPASNVPVDPASGSSWSAWNTPAVATGTTGSASGSWSAWDDPTATGPRIAKYTGGAVANTFTYGGALVVVLVGMYIL